MKKLLISLVALATLVTSVFAQDTNTKKYVIQPKDGQVGTQSTSWNLSLNDGFSLVYLQDGLGQDHSAISYKLYILPVLDGKLSINAIGSYDTQNNNVYMGTALSYQVFDTKGFKLNVLAGWKGFDFSSTSFTGGKGGFVWGVGLTIPLGSIGN